MNHDLIAIGASAGGIEVLLDMVRELPEDLPASVFVVVHVPASHTSSLPELLSARGPLPAKHPLHDEKIVPGHIYVAPPDNHLMIRQGTMEVVRGPKENGHRPAADVLFRTASAAYGSRVIGVVLSGYGDCGTAGMMSIKARGGLGVVQTPESAQAPNMPSNVLARVAVDHMISPAQLPGLLARLARTSAGPALPVNEFVKQLEGDEPGTRAEVVCPICDGVLTEAQPGVFQHFRCHVGHSFSLESLVREQSEELERTLWAAVRVLEESAALSRRLSLVERGELRQSFAEKAATHSQQADYLRQMLLHGQQLLSKVDADRMMMKKK
jgi:two-component system, chemotaxis family, protein-glutamate methylesterase/glutaminase